MKRIKGLFNANKVYLGYIWKNHKMYLLFLIFSLLIEVPKTIISLYAPKEFINNIIYENSIQKALIWIAAMLLINLFYEICTNLKILIRKDVRSKASLEVVIKTYKHFNNLNLSFFENKKNIDKAVSALDYAKNECDKLPSFLVGLVSLFLEICSISYVSIKFDWWIWLIFLLEMVLHIKLDNKSIKLYNTYSKETLARKRLINYFTEIFFNKEEFAEMQVYDSRDYLLNKHIDLYLQDISINKRRTVKEKRVSLSGYVINGIVLFIFYLFIGLKLYQKEATIGDYTLFFSMVTHIESIALNIRYKIKEFKRILLYTERYNDFIYDKSNYIYSDIDEKEIVPIQRIETIDIKNLTFRHNNQKKAALDNVSFSIKRGDKISLVGLNGAGKTTLIDLLLMLFKPESGGIFINGYDSKYINRKDFWKRIGVVFQKYGTYSVSVADNIVFGKEEEKEKINEVLSKVGMEEKIDKLPNRTETMISNSLYTDGVDFSGGEKQRFAIARAMIKDADLYIFDEPSSNIDAKAEEELYDIINQIPEDKTVIFISHRLSSVSSTNRIIVIDDGKVIGDGSHSELMSDCPKYKDMYQTQSKRYGVGNNI